MIQYDRKLRAILQKSGLVDEERAAALVEKARADDRSLTEIIIRDEVATESQLLALVARAANIPPIDLDKVRFNPEVVASVPIDVAKDYRIFPVDRIGSIITIAVANPFDVLKLDDIRIITGCELRPVLSTAEAIEKILPIAYRSDEESVGDILDSFDDNGVGAQGSLGRR